MDDRLASHSSNNPLERQSKEYKSKTPTDNTPMPKNTILSHSGAMAMPERTNSVPMRTSGIVCRQSGADARNAHRHNKMGKRSKEAHKRSSRRKAQKLFYRKEGIVQQNTLTMEPESHFLTQGPSPSTSSPSPVNANILDILTKPASTERADRERIMVQRVIATHGEHQFYSYNAIEFLAKVYWDEGLQDEAIEILQKSLESRQCSLGQEQLLNAFSIEQLAGWYLEKGEFHNAVLYLSRATKILSLHFGEGDVRTQSMRTVLANAVQKQNTARYL